MPGFCTYSPIAWDDRCREQRSSVCFCEPTSFEADHDECHVGQRVCCCTKYQRFEGLSTLAVDGAYSECLKSPSSDQADWSSDAASNAIRVSGSVPAQRIGRKQVWDFQDSPFRSHAWQPHSASRSQCRPVPPKHRSLAWPAMPC